MELFIVLFMMMIHQWLVIPIIKRKVGYERPDEPTIFYAYKTKWQLPAELGIVVLAVAAVALFTPTLGIWSVLFIPVAMSGILALRGVLEKKYEPYMKHYVISFIQASVLLSAFVSLIVYASVTSSM